ncbi:uncharacterized protein LOC100833833 [Brachypodium distachyon]|uniref:Uncharacterized protein n=1 Tax=Brachypodium distachyon TaxID=15368 RepID=I1GKY0_BRADI|nr:uncharacterized protein LOC100833833 [Brachypodium distachyon]KQK12154.1 hypothetical protein BRADI_1g01890v3 [Brachypodium distachyon]|eukprot:XP_010234786.1 uncharacterized protein LOC100833833 [Brachypodium distachyon]
MSHGGGGGDGGSSSSSSSCMSLSLGKFIRRALRGGKQKRLKQDDKAAAAAAGRRRRAADGYYCASSIELLATSSSSSSWTPAGPAASSSSSSAPAVVRVVLWSGVVEVYTGVVLARAVIQNHPPGLCLAHPDVFRNPHGAMVRPLEPLFPGQKFFLLPESTIRKLQRAIPESSVGAFDDDDEDEDEEYETSSAEIEISESEEETGAVPGCCARDYFVDRERWAEWQFKRMVARGIAVEQEGRSAGEIDKKKKRRRKKQRKELPRLAPAPPPCRMRAVRSWEPSLPSVVEEASPSPDLRADRPADQEARTDHETP